MSLRDWLSVPSDRTFDRVVRFLGIVVVALVVVTMLGACAVFGLGFDS